MTDQISSSHFPSILIIDDDVDLVDVFAKTFAKQNYHVVAQTDAQAAIQSINQKKFDVIITDMVMPKFNGIQFLHAVKSSQLNNSAPVIVLSGTLSPDMREALLKVGVTKAFAKPVYIKDIVEFVNKIISHSGNFEELEKINETKEAGQSIHSRMKFKI